MSALGGAGAALWGSRPGREAAARPSPQLSGSGAAVPGRVGFLARRSNATAAGRCSRPRFGRCGVPVPYRCRTPIRRARRRLLPRVRSAGGCGAGAGGAALPQKCGTRSGVTAKSNTSPYFLIKSVLFRAGCLPPTPRMSWLCKH